MSQVGEETELALADSGSGVFRLTIVLGLIYGAAALPAIHFGTIATPIAATLFFAAALLALSVIDAVTFRLPDLITLPLLAAGLALAAIGGPDALSAQLQSTLAAGLGLYAVGALYRGLRGRDGLGFGDVKLFAAGGAWIAIDALPSALLVACCAAIAMLVFKAATAQPLQRTTAIPFGPFLALGLWVAWLYGALA